MDGPMAAGEHIAFHIDDATGLWTPIHRLATPNTLLYTWGHIASRCIGMGDARYRVAMAYLEFENGEGPVSVPAYNREDGLQYYMDLTSSRRPRLSPGADPAVPGYRRGSRLRTVPAARSR